MVAAGQQGTALTGELGYRHEVFIKRLALVVEMQDELSAARESLTLVAGRSANQVWTPVPCLSTFAEKYLGVVNTTLAQVDQAEIKVAALVESLRLFANELRVTDEYALDSLSTLETAMDIALAPPAPAAPALPQYNLPFTSQWYASNPV